MSLLNSLGQFSTALQVGGGVASLAGAAKALIKPKKAIPGIGGFVFDIPETETVKLQAQITRHYAQDNYSLGDHIAFEPATLTLVGDIGELVMTKSKYEKFAQQVIDRLSPLSALAPGLSTSASQYLSEISRLKSASESTMKQFDSLADAFGFSLRDGEGNLIVGDTRSAQQRAYDTLSQMFYGRSEITCETPWRTFGPGDKESQTELEIASGVAQRSFGHFPMVIESLEFFQDDDTKELSRVTVTLTEFRTVSIDAGKGALKKRAAKQAAKKVVKGKPAGDNNTALMELGQGIGGP
jgi:hypothetical protein